MSIEPDLSSPEWEKRGFWIQEAQQQSANKHSYPLDSESLLALDQQGMPEGTSVAAVVRSLLDSAVDDLASAFALVTEAGRPSPVGIPTLVRGSIELAGVGTWVLTGTGRSGRQERGLRVAHDSLINAKKYFTRISRDPTVPANVKEEAIGSTRNFEQQAKDLAASSSFLGIKKSLVTASLNRTDALQQVDKPAEPCSSRDGSCVLALRMAFPGLPSSSTISCTHTPWKAAASSLAGQWDRREPWLFCIGDSMRLKNCWVHSIKGGSLHRLERE
jgi:hypothetical protein